MSKHFIAHSIHQMTPSAARGVLDAIFWKPEFRGQIREIRVLKPIRYFSILRNEVNSRATFAMGQRRRRGEEGYYAEEDPFTAAYALPA